MNKLQQRWGKYVGQAACSHCHATFSGAYCPKCQSEEDDSVRVCSHCGQLMYIGRDLRIIVLTNVFTSTLAQGNGRRHTPMGTATGPNGIKFVNENAGCRRNIKISGPAALKRRYQP